MGGDMQSSERDAEATSSKASKAEFAKNYDQAFKLYVKAAESFLHLSRSTTSDDKTKQKWKTNASKALERAEKIKRFVEKPRGTVSSGVSDPNRTSTVDIRLTPVSINHFSPQEQFYVLRKGGSINGLYFPLWDDPVAVKEAQTSNYSDPDGQPKLSPEQQKFSPVWRRPNSCVFTDPASKPRRRILPQEILQHIVTDCSVCASISVCLEHGRRFGSSLESSIHGATGFRQNSHLNYTSVEGRYDVRVLFNGAWRRIVIDDQLPFHPVEGTLMCMSVLPSPSDSCGVSNETLWPSLLEKAYMKLMGGYNFPGSNSSIDLHALAGWIPEHIEIKSSTFERERTWERIAKGFSAGQCVITLGTGPSSYIRWKDVSFLPSHSYAVIDAYEAEEGRIFTVLDSWVRDNDTVGKPSRVLHIPWSDVLNTFDGVYLSWDPVIWQNTLTFHGMWKRSSDEDNGSRQAYVEFTNDSDRDEEIWILLTRHVVDTHQSSEFIALRVEVEDQNKEAHIVEKQRLLFTKGTYTNSTHILSRTRIPVSQRSGILSISASCDGEAREVGFTLIAYSNANVNIKWLENNSTPPFVQKVDGSFTSKTSGGNYTYSSFMVNPQYRLIVHPVQTSPDRLDSTHNKARITLTLQTKRDIPVNVAMVWSQGRRVSELAAKELVATSGSYSYGLARIAQNITSGEYTVVASAFEPHHMGPFSLKVECSYPFDLKSIAQEGAGMYSKVIRGSWERDTATGGPSFDRYSQNPIFELEIPSTAQVMIRLQLLQPSTAVALNVTVYPGSKDGLTSALERQNHVATSGAYDDSIAGVATQQATLASGKYYIVPSTYNPGVELGFRLLIYSSIAGFKVQEVERASAR